MSMPIFSLIRPMSIRTSLMLVPNMRFAVSMLLSIRMISSILSLMVFASLDVAAVVIALL